jgi:hypothetical protein
MFHPKPLFVVVDWLKAKKDFLFCPKFGGVFEFEHFQQVQRK